MRTSFLLLLLVPALALAQYPAPTTGTATSATADAHAGQQLQAGSFVSSADGGTSAIVIPVNTKACFDSNCNTYVVSDGGVVTVAGAELAVPSGFTDSQKVNDTTINTPLSMVAQAAPGQRAVGVAHDGARIYFGSGGNIYCASDGSQVVCGSAWLIPSMSTDTIGNATANRVVDFFNLHIYPTNTLGTCDGQGGAGHIPEGTKKVLSASSTSTQSRECICVSDGAGTPAWTWVNTGCPKTAGTSTTCPACP